ncbi:MAG: tetratricopeptide repeat protein [Planctomycetes bacterium]|nr:tetratricopeptide repeat protein [Planctomycetota bacterium]
MKSQSTLPVLVAALWIAGCGAPATPAEEPSAAEAASPAAPAVAPPAESPAAADGAETAGASEPEPEVEELSWSELDRRGDEHLKAGRFDEAIADFDAAVALEPGLEAHHWRRGIAHYYAGRYADGAAQFELHRTVNANDVENAAWHFLCVARTDGVDAARQRLLPVAPDSRVPMMEVLEMFAGRSTPIHVLEAAKAADGTAQSESALFYAYLYVGLFNEVMGRPEEAKAAIEIAATEHTSPYYMGDVARVHAARLAE